MKKPKNKRRLRFVMLAPICVLLTSSFADTPPNLPPAIIHTPMSARPYVSLYGGDSGWASSEKQSYTALFSGAHYAWFVAPIQIRENGFDRAERSMMNAELARALEAHDLPVQDSYLTERALGDGQRQIPLSEINALSSRVGATTILVPRVEHDDAGNIKLKVEVYRKTGGSASIETAAPTQTISLSRKYVGSLTPIDAFDNLLPDLLTALGVVSPGHSTSASAQQGLTLPATPELLATAEDGNAIGNAARLCVMGELAPPWKRDSERLFERCLLLARQSPDTAQQRFLLAYALFKLNLRTAADQVLRGQLAPAPIALRAIIDGNLTGTARLASKSTGHERLILEFELHDLSVAYNHVGEAELPLPPALMVLSKGSDSWAILLHQRWDISRRTPKDNVPLKRLLDKFYPIDGQSLIDLAAAHKATPGAGLTEWDLQLMVHRHVRELMVDKSASWCCSRGQGLPAPWDYVSVIEAWSDENLFHDVDYQLSFLGLPEKARVLLSALDPIYNGQPDFEILQAEAERAMAAKMPQAQQVAFLSAVHRHALQALSGAGGQDADAIYAMSLLGAGDATATELARIYGGDYPFYPYWLDVDFAIDPSKRLSLAKIALASTQTGVGFASLILQDSGEAGKSDVRAAISGRFIGNPALDQVLEQLRPTSLNIDTDDRQLIARLRGQVAEKPEVFETRSRLAKVLVDQGQYAAAGKVLTAFPEFRKKTATDGVYLSNLAGESGHMFYWRGAEREARELYSIATRYHVGSESEMIAELHMALLDGNMEGALRAAGERAERYPNGLSYCNYISLLHLMGRSDEAWQIFNLLTDQPMGFPPWESAMVGLRMAGTDQNGLTRWIAQPKITRAGTPAISYAAHFLTVWNTTDRMAPFDFAERVATLTDERTGIIEGDGRVASYPTNKPGNRFLVVRSDFRADQRAVMTLGTRVDSDEILFARALVKSQHGDFSTAVSRFDDLAARYPIEREVGDADATYALPDFAYASAKSGDPLSLERFLTGLPSDAQFFTLYLAKAYFDALTHKKNDAALSDLDDAFSFMNHIFGATPSNEYQFADVAERLYRETKDPRFRDRSVRWAHSFQRLQPWAAWAYVVEAKLSVDSSARRTALVRALFLDPLSPRLNAIPDAELVAAREELRKGNPFVRRTDANPRTVALSRAALEIAP